MNQRGFATLEVILMVMVIGILASIAVPRFTSVTTAANTAKIQADLSTIDTAIAVAEMSGTIIAAGDVNSTAALKDYLQDYDKIKPPTGKCYVNGDEKDAGSKYEIASVTVGTENNTTTQLRAVLKIENANKTSGDFTKS